MEAGEERRFLLVRYILHGNVILAAAFNVFFLGPLYFALSSQTFSFHNHNNVKSMIDYGDS